MPRVPLVIAALLTSTPAGAEVLFEHGRFETVEAPGFAVDHQHCDGSLSTPVVLPLPKPLSRRFEGSQAIAEVRLDADGRTGELARQSGEAALLDELAFGIERARFAPGADCVRLRFRVTDTVIKAADVVRIRPWADIAIDRRGQVRDVTIVDELHPAIVDALKSRMAAWRFDPDERLSGDEVRTTSVLLEAEMIPSGPGRMRVDARPIRAGPRPLRELRPALPGRMKGRRKEGKVEVAFMVDEDGRPRDPVVLSAEPPGVFDRYAVMNVKRWRYKPETVDGDPVVSGPVSVVVDFAEARYRETHRSLVVSRRSWHRIDRRFEDPSPFPDWEDDDDF